MPETPLAVFSPVFTRADDRGGLSVVERGPTMPFEVKRVYWVHGTQPGIVRGFHAHRRLQQICFCLAGSVRLGTSTSATRTTQIRGWWVKFGSVNDAPPDYTFRTTYFGRP